MYDVVILVEEELSVADAEQIVQLYADAPDRVQFHVVIPCEDAKTQVEASLADLAGSDLFGITTQRFAVRADDEVRVAAEEAQRAVDAQATEALNRSVGRLRSFDREAEGLITRKHPIDELADYIGRVNGQEVVVLTRPHVIAELLHIDWSAQARRHLGVPVLHLLEQHRDSIADRTT
ncbi:hypothetical protein EV651_10990 [Kribbella sp. VKM Ac-2571]|uniref:hypothetical protein n=1 Tax=Kribbella sp. VKM Ac-2571 TaxID=2512222 RepID=UPI00105FBD84|nr:hypothetical protein [Kribbella sp. VKM Ac-2571]TDO58815.1 hypothetical protein EV651_10990 [Kribbella sp. VKM Ac-2571]